MCSVSYLAQDCSNLIFVIDEVQEPSASAEVPHTRVDQKPAVDSQVYDVILSSAPEDAEFATEIKMRLQERYCPQTPISWLLLLILM